MNKTERKPKPIFSRSIKREIIADIASAMHEDWRSSLKDPSSPWLRPDRDLDGNKIEGSEVDINVDFEDLTEGWRIYNSQAAKSYVERLFSYEDPDDVEAEELASDIHDIWMNDNEWMRDSRPDLFVPFSKLAPEEAKKDVDMAQRVISTAQMYAFLYGYDLTGRRVR